MFNLKLTYCLKQKAYVHNTKKLMFKYYIILYNFFSKLLNDHNIQCHRIWKKNKFIIYNVCNTPPSLLSINSNKY